MSGHHAGHKPRNTPPAADHRLDQFAAAVAEARNTNPALAALSATEAQFIDAAMDIGGHLDRPTVGAAWLILGQLFGTNLANVPPEQQAGALAMLLNVAKLAGQRLYEGDRLPVEMRCPFTFATGAPCTKTVKGPNQERVDVLLRAHIWQAHPGETWPPTPADGPVREQARLTHYSRNGDGNACGAAGFATDKIGEATCEACRDSALEGDDLFPPPIGEALTFDQLKRFANVRVLAMTSLAVDRQYGDPVTGRKGELTPQAAWEQAERDYDRLMAERPVAPSASPEPRAWQYPVGGGHLDDGEAIEGGADD